MPSRKSKFEIKKVPGSNKFKWVLSYKGEVIAVSAKSYAKPHLAKRAAQAVAGRAAEAEFVE